MNVAVDSTSAGTALRQLQTPVLLGLMLTGIGTSPGPDPASISLRQPLRIEQTNAGVSLPDESSGAAIAELRRVSGFTWDQLARLFGVTRRSLHFWASGKAMTVENQERLQHLLATVRQVDRGSATANRDVLMAVRQDGTVPFDLLTDGQYTRVISVLGQGSGRPAIKPPALSAAARAARRPRPPHELVNAAPDERVEKGRLLATKAIRISRET
jgi:DNA-binding transcriptional regulator YiaG